MSNPLQFEDIYNTEQNFYIEAWHVEEHETGVKATKKTKVVPLLSPPLVEHKKGAIKIGLYPFADKFNVNFGAIDIDTYPVDHKEMAKKLKDKNVEYSWMTKSTSKGCHIYFRYKEPMLAATVRKQLAAVAASIGYANSEIFPKQDKFDPEQKDNGKWKGLGNAIYLPYGSDTSCVMDLEGEKELTIEEFEKFAPGRFIDKINPVLSHVTTPEVREVKVQHTNTQLNEREVLVNGPPCLNRLQTIGIAEGGRNKAMFNYAVLLKKAKGSVILQDLKVYAAACNNPIGDTELEVIIDSVNSSDYDYTCKEEPIKALCNREACGQMKFGKNPSVVDLERFPWVYAKNDNWFAHNESGQIIDPNHFSNIVTAEYYWNDAAEKPHTKTSYLGSRNTDKVDRVGYHPGRERRYKRDGKNYINVYRPSLLEPVAGDISAWLTVIEYMIEDPVYRALFHSWLHSVVTNPGQFITWSPLIISKQGMGKDLVAQGMKEMVGMANTFINDMKLIMQTHTGHMMHKCFGVMSETKEYGTSDRGKAMEVLKPLITDRDLKIRAMNKDAIWVENTINCIFFSNHRNCITLDMDARRFMVIMSDRQPKPRAFYAPAWELVTENPGVILDYYLNKFKPHKDFHAGGNAPETTFKKELVNNTSNPDFIALDAFAEQGMHPFAPENPYINLEHLARGFEIRRKPFDYATLQYWVQWRATQGKAEQHADIDLYGKRIRIWTLDPQNFRETDRQKLRDQYLIPTEYGGHKTWNWDKVEKCPKCGRKHTPASKEYVDSPF